MREKKTHIIVCTHQSMKHKKIDALSRSIACHDPRTTKDNLIVLNNRRLPDMRKINQSAAKSSKKGKKLRMTKQWTGKCTPGQENNTLKNDRRIRQRGNKQIE